MNKPWLKAGFGAVGLVLLGFFTTPSQAADLHCAIEVNGEVHRHVQGRGADDESVVVGGPVGLRVEAFVVLVGGRDEDDVRLAGAGRALILRGQLLDRRREYQQVGPQHRDAVGVRVMMRDRVEPLEAGGGAREVRRHDRLSCEEPRGDALQ